jgi:putative membrane protein
MRDLLLTIGHHILVFALVAVLAAEIAAIRPNMRPDQIDHLAKLDRAYGIVAMLVIVFGVSRVIWGAKGSGFFVENPWFWAKMATFVVISLISIAPTLRIRAWNLAARANPAASPGEAEIVRTRNYMLAEAALLPLILIFAAAMVRYGAF